MLNFLMPFMLWGMAAAIAPLIIHLFAKTRVRIVRFAAMDFLLANTHRSRRRVKYRDALLILIRMLAFVLLALALARPTIQNSVPTVSSPIAAVLVFDLSFSMDSKENGRTRLDKAKEFALALLRDLPSGSRVKVITFANRANVIGPVDSEDLMRAAELVADLRVAHVPGDIAAGLREAITAFELLPVENRRLFLFTDLQRRDWDRQSFAIKGHLAAIKQFGASLNVVRCGSRLPGNVTIDDLYPIHWPIRPGVPSEFLIRVQNTGPSTQRNVSVSLAGDAKGVTPDSRTIPEIGPDGEAIQVTLTAVFAGNGLRLVQATVGPDDLEADNRLDRVVSVRDRANVLIVDGEPLKQQSDERAASRLRQALSPPPTPGKPDLSILKTQVVLASSATPATLTEKELCVFVDVSVEGDGGNRVSPDFLKAVESFVRDGHSLLFFNNGRVPPESYNRTLGWKIPGLMPVVLVPTQATAQGIDRLNGLSDRPFSKLREEAYGPLDQLRIRTAVSGVPALGDELSGPGRILIQLKDGRPFVIGRRVGRGHVLFVVAAADALRTDWLEEVDNTPAGMFMIINQMLAEYALDSPVRAHNLTAGELIPPPRGELAAQRFLIERPDRTRRQLLREEVSSFDTAMAGVYWLRPENEDTEAEPFAVRPDPNETNDMTALSEAELDQWIWFLSSHSSVADDAASVHTLPASEGYYWILFGVLVLLVGEAFLARRADRARVFGG